MPEKQFIKTALTCLVLCFVSANSFALDILVNGSLYKKWTPGEIEREGYTIPAYGTESSGITLDELFPCMFDAWELSVTSGAGRITVSADNPADMLSSWAVIIINGRPVLFAGGKEYPDLTAINLDGEVVINRELEVWLNWEGCDLLKSEISRYAAMHGLQIKTVEVPRTDSKLSSVHKGGGNVPDVVMVQSGSMEELSRSDSIQALDYMKSDGLVRQGEEAFSLRGRLWAVPFYYDAQVFFYNPDIVASPEPDWTLSDFESACAPLAGSDVYPSSWNAYSASFLIPFQKAFGKERLIEPDGSIIINDGPNLLALEYILNLQERGLLVPMERDAMTSLFISGKTAFIISASYSIPYFEKLGIPFGIAPLPLSSEDGRRVSALLDFKGLAIPRKSRNPVAARRLVEYLCGPGVQQRFTSAVSKLPVREDVKAVSAQTNRYYETLEISSATGTIVPPDKSFAVYKNTMWKMLRFALSGRMNAAGVLEQTQKLVDKNLE